MMKVLIKDFNPETRALFDRLLEYEIANTWISRYFFWIPWAWLTNLCAFLVAKRTVKKFERWLIMTERMNAMRLKQAQLAAMR